MLRGGISVVMLGHVHKGVRRLNDRKQRACQVHGAFQVLCPGARRVFSSEGDRRLWRMKLAVTLFEVAPTGNAVQLELHGIDDVGVLAIEQEDGERGHVWVLNCSLQGSLLSS